MKNKTENSKHDSLLIESKAIDGTPFIARKFDDFWIITCGNVRGSKKFKSFEEAELSTTFIDWDLVMTLLTATHLSYTPSKQ